MNNNNTFANDLKRSILKFSDSISIGLKVPKRKFIRDMIYGILASKAVQLASIGRSLKVFEYLSARKLFFSIRLKTTNFLCGYHCPNSSFPEPSGLTR